jgi:hypothetical protein
MLFFLCLALTLAATRGAELREGRVVCLDSPLAGTLGAGEGSGALCSEISHEGLITQTRGGKALSTTLESFSSWGREVPSGLQHLLSLVQGGEALSLQPEPASSWCQEAQSAGLLSLVQRAELLSGGPLSYTACGSVAHSGAESVVPGGGGTQLLAGEASFFAGPSCSLVHAAPQGAAALLSHSGSLAHAPGMDSLFAGRGQHSSGVDYLVGAMDSIFPRSERSGVGDLMARGVLSLVHEPLHSEVNSLVAYGALSVVRDDGEARGPAPLPHLGGLAAGAGFTWPAGAVSILLAGAGGISAEQYREAAQSATLAQGTSGEPIGPTAPPRAPPFAQGDPGRSFGMPAGYVSAVGQLDCGGDCGEGSPLVPTQGAPEPSYAP